MEITITGNDIVNIIFWVGVFTTILFVLYPWRK
jgi:hypothetical protein